MIHDRGGECGSVSILISVHSVQTAGQVARGTCFAFFEALAS